MGRLSFNKRSIFHALFPSLPPPSLTSLPTASCLCLTSRHHPLRCTSASCRTFASHRTSTPRVVPLPHPRLRCLVSVTVETLVPPCSASSPASPASLLPPFLMSANHFGHGGNCSIFRARKNILRFGASVGEIYVIYNVF
jgi:hypothetical protein